MAGGAAQSTRSVRVLRRLAWFVALWLAGVVSLGVVALMIRWAIAG